MEILLALSWLVITTVGVVGFIKPRWVFMPSRWAVLAFGSSSIIIMGAAIEFYPAPGQPPAKGIFFGFIVFWLFCLAIVIALRIGFRTQFLADLAEPTIRNNGFVERFALAWANRIKAGRNDSMIVRANITPNSPPAKSSEKWTLKKVPTALKFRRENKEVEALQQPISLDPWLEKRSKTVPKEVLQYLNKEPSSRDGERYKSGITRAAAPKKSNHYWEHGATGGEAWFEYVDADGVITDRHVANWHEDGPYINAYDLDKRASRTFRKDRISDFESE